MKNMKTYLCVIVIIALDVSQISGNYWLGHEYSYNENSAPYVDNSREQYTRDHQVANLYRPDQQNDRNYVERPCSIQDVKCIRSFLAYNFKCYPVYGPAPDPFIIKTIPMAFPHANLTMTLNDARVQGLNSGRIQEFYINRKTDTLVLEVELAKLVVHTPNTLVTYHRKGKEPIKASDLTLIEFRNLSLTLTTSISNMNLDNTFVYAYQSDSKPLLQVGSGLLRSSERDQSAMDMTWLNNIELSVKEALATAGPIYMAGFIESKICDFRHKKNTVYH